MVQEPENHVNVSFAEAPDVFPVLAALFQREEARRVAAGEDQQQVHGESAATARSHFVRQFHIDFSTTVEDLTAAIIHFLRDNAGVLNNTTAHVRRTQTAEEGSISLV